MVDHADLPLVESFNPEEGSDAAPFDTGGVEMVEGAEELALLVLGMILKKGVKIQRNNTKRFLIKPL